MKNAANQEHLILTETPDGSYTFRHTVLQETYHSVNGAKTESQHVYIEQGLAKIEKETIHVFELGFGTGLNAFLTWQFAVDNHKTVHYATIEKYPVSPQLLKAPDFTHKKNKSVEIWHLIHSAKWDEANRIDFNFILIKQQADIAEFNFNCCFDIVYYDAFAPSVQPEMWTSEIFQKIYNAITPGGLLVTYSCAGSVKRALTTAGFNIERLKGPPGKKHMLKATKHIHI